MFRTQRRINRPAPSLPITWQCASRKPRHFIAAKSQISLVNIFRVNDEMLETLFILMYIFAGVVSQNRLASPSISLHL